MSEAVTPEPVTPAPSSASSPSLIESPTGGEPPKPAEGEAAAKPAEAPAPEFKPLAAADLKFPEGFSADDPSVSKFLEITNGAKLGTEQVQALVALQTDLMKQASEAGSKLWEETQTGWQKEVREDPTIGGPALEENLSHVAKLIDRFGGEKAQAIREAFSYTGAGNNPAIVRFMVAIGKELSDPSPVSGRPTSAPTDAAAVLYPSQGKA